MSSNDVSSRSDASREASATAAATGIHGEPLRGLYDPAFERDSCGFGVIANLDDQASHWLVATALVSLTLAPMRPTFFTVPEAPR